MGSSENMSDTCTEDKRSMASSRRSNKPLMEKRRRARINECLGQLKGLVLQALKKDSAQYSKLEKADILEMTVKHLKMMQRQQLAAAMTSDPMLMSKYRAGFNECAGEVARYLDAVSVGHDVKSRVLNHLANCVTHIPSETQQQTIHPAHIPALHVLPQGTQPPYSISALNHCAPVWNIVPSAVHHQTPIQMTPYSKLERLERPRFTPSPDSLPDTHSSPDSSPSSSPHSKCDLDLYPRRLEAYTPPRASHTPPMVSVKQERDVTPSRGVPPPERDSMWRPW